MLLKQKKTSRHLQCLFIIDTRFYCVFDYSCGLFLQRHGSTEVSIECEFVVATESPLLANEKKQAKMFSGST